MKPKVLIVGGGPAGSACGIELARRGIEATVFERDAPYREKVCGDGLNFDSQKALTRLGLFEEIRKKAQIIPKAIIYGYRGEEIVIPETFLTLHRSELDQTLRERVETLGGNVIYESRIEGIEITPGGVCVKDHRGNAYSGDVLVLATGTRTRLAESLGFTFRFRTAVALRGYIPNTRKVNAYHFWLSKDIFPGYAWAFPCPGGTLNIGVIYFESNKPQKNLHQMLQRFMHKTARQIVNGSDFIWRPKGFQLRTGLRREPSYADRVLLVGENVDCSYDLSGEGIGKALESGILAAETLAQAPPPYTRQYLSLYQDRLISSCGKYHDGYSKVMCIMGNPLGNFLFTKLMAHSPKIQAELVSIFKEEKVPQELFSVRGLVKTLVS